MSEPSSQRGRPKDPAKRAAILAAAKTLFLREGYVGTSMEAVAVEAGVSKPTVYSHFASKERLFSVAVKEETQTLLPHSAFTLQDRNSLDGLLCEIGRAFVGLINSPEAIGLHRLMAANVGQEGDMARLFFEAGPEVILRQMEQLLKQAHQRQLLHIEDVELATEHFFGLLQGCQHMQVLIGYRSPLPAAETGRRVREATAMFLRAYTPSAFHRD